VISKEEYLIKEVGDIPSNNLDEISLSIDHMNVQKMLPPREEVQILFRKKKKVWSHMYMRM